MIIYGIKNCDTTQKAIKWLNAKKINFTFHDYKESGIDRKKLEEWLRLQPLSTIVNTKSTTYRGLNEEEKASITNKFKATRLMISNTSLIKRPILEAGNELLVGFNESTWSGVIGKR